MFDKNVYIERREGLKSLLKSGVVILPGNQESPRNYRGNNYHFEQDASFLYYFGMNVPNLIGVIDVDNDKEYIFGTDFTLDDIVWMGEQKLLKSFAEDVGINNFVEMTEFSQFANSLLEEKRELLFLPQYRSETTMQLSKYFKIDPFNFNNFASEKLILSVVEQRNTKSTLEISEIEKAVNITREMHLKAMEVVKPGMKEYEVVAALEEVAARYNASTSFHTIFTRNGQILHNHYHGNTLQEGDLVVLDAGARIENGYCGDMTTSFPVSGKFTDVQKDIYSLLIEMFEKAEELIKPGITYKEVHLEVCKVLTEGMKKRGLMKGDTEEAVKAGAHALFFPHGLGHMLGLDVHDMEALGENYVGYEDFPREMQFGLKSLRLARKLRPGYVFTVEPGIYFIPELVRRWKEANKFTEYLNYEKIEKYLSFGGMRYEGDFLITETGARRLGDKMPKYPHEVEACINR